VSHQAGGRLVLQDDLSRRLLRMVAFQGNVGMWNAVLKELLLQPAKVSHRPLPYYLPPHRTRFTGWVAVLVRMAFAPLGSFPPCLALLAIYLRDFAQVGSLFLRFTVGTFRYLFFFLFSLARLGDVTVAPAGFAGSATVSVAGVEAHAAYVGPS